MTYLILGVALFAGVHLVPSLAGGIKSAIWERLGEGGYKGIFSLLLVGAFALMIYGWRNTIPQGIYAPPEALRLPALALMCLAFLVMGASTRNSRIRLFIRHPQLTGVALWGVAHLLLNGDSRSLVLFGGLALWAAIEIVTISRREGVWIKEAAPGWGAEVVTLLIAVVTIAVLVFAHPWLSGVSALPG